MECLGTELSIADNEWNIDVLILPAAQLVEATLNVQYTNNGEPSL